MNELTTTHHNTVTEDQIDVLGHMNVHYYAAAAERGTEVMTDLLAATAGGPLEAVDVYTRHHHEQVLGAELVVESGVAAVESTSVALYHQLANPETDQLAATFIHRLAAPQGKTLSDELRENASARLVSVPSRGAPRSINLEHDVTAAAPRIDEVRSRGLAICHPWELAADQCDDDGSLTRTLMRAIPWMGEPITTTVHEPIRTTDEGVQLGMATMETRVSINRLPHQRDRIETFGALHALGEKTTHSRQWSYESDTGELLVSFETVLLAFDVSTRRSVAIPDSIRSADEQRLHPDLGS